jgi:hypothetical protein
MATAELPLVAALPTVAELPVVIEAEKEKTPGPRAAGKPVAPAAPQTLTLF